MTKKLNEDVIKNELQDSAFFNKGHEHKPIETEIVPDENKHVDKQTSQHVYMKTCLARKPTGFASFRLAPKLIERHEELQYLLKKHHK
jgi:hypothetical protein